MKPRTSRFFDPRFVFGFFVGILVASLAFALLSRGQGDQAGSSTRVLKVAHSLPGSHPVHRGLVNFAEEVEALSNGQLALEIYPNGQLGSETEILEQVQAGHVDISKVGSASLSSFAPVFRLFSLPYLFRSEAHYWAFLEGPQGQEILSSLGKPGSGGASGIQGLTYYNAGSRNFYTSKPILNPRDLSGLKIRVMDDPIAMGTVKSLGASPTPIPFGEVYTSLQQGIVDGAENNPQSFVESNHFEVCKHFSFDSHSRNPDVVVISTAVWETLSGAEQAWLQEAANRSRQYQRSAWEESIKGSMDLMREQGVTIHQPEVEPFYEATRSVREVHSRGELAAIVEAIGQIEEGAR